MEHTQKEELVSRIEDEHGVHVLFKELGFENVSRKNKNIYCVCPFHEGADNPSGFAYSNGFGFCFTHCHKKLDLFSIVMEAKKCEFGEAVAYLCNLVGMDTDYMYKPKVTSDSIHNREFLKQVKRAKSKRIIEPKPFDPNVLNDFTPALHSILRKEGFDNDIRDYFQLGFSQMGYLENRITIPIDYIDETILTVSGRSVLSDKELEEQKVKRYLIWFDTDKSITLYNISRALPYIDITGEVFVVEGFKSIWRLHQWGYRNAVATMGSSISDEQLTILLKLNCRIVVCGDKDRAGKELNENIYGRCNRFADVDIMDMYSINIPDKSSIDDITKSQFDYINNNRK